MFSEGYCLDGKPVRRFIFIRFSHLLKRGLPVEVWGFTKDHAFERLQKHYPYIPGVEWEMIEEIENPAHTLGKMGDIIRLDPMILRNETN